MSASTALEFLKQQTFFLATVENGQPRVRPFGFVMQREGRLYFCTSRRKPMYAQLCAQTAVEISACTPENAWIRIRGTIAFDDSLAAKAQVFQEMPMLLRRYPKGVADESFITFYLDSAEATVSSFGGPSQIIPLV